MARNPKMAYFEVGLPRDSAALSRLTSESRETGTSIPKLISVKLHEYYCGQRTVMETSVLSSPPASPVLSAAERKAKAFATYDSDE